MINLYKIYTILSPSNNLKMKTIYYKNMVIFFIHVDIYFVYVHKNLLHIIYEGICIFIQ